jgi:hypothetical protein
MLDLHVWETVNDDPKDPSETERMKVPGGWLYRSVTWGPDGNDPAIALAFVPGVYIRDEED